MKRVLQLMPNRKEKFGYCVMTETINRNIIFGEKHIDHELSHLLYVLKKIKESTNFIDFDCNFDKGGLCKSRRTRFFKNVEMEKKERCCCFDCYNSGGYLYSSVIDERDVKTYLKLFERDRGFWRPKKGCILPRGLRSFACIFHRCLMGKKEEERNFHLLTTLSTCFNVINKQIKEIHDKIEISMLEKGIDIYKM